MATTVDRVQISHRRAIQRRYDDDQKHMAVAIALLLLQLSQRGQLSADNRTRLYIKAQIWLYVLKPYYVGATEPFIDAAPQSPFATLVRDGVEGAMRIQVKRSIAMLKRYIKDVGILAWLLAPNPFGKVELPPVKQANIQSPFYAYTDPNGYKLNDRILRNAIDARAKLDRMIDFHIMQGTEVGAMGAAVANYMTICGRSTGKSYGEYGSYAPWKMLRGEMLVAAGRATIVASLLNPVVDMVQWRLGAGHAKADECDSNASGGQNSDGVYPINSTPPYPSHNNCRCSLWPVASSITDEQRNQMLIAIQTRNEVAQMRRGSLNEDSLIRSLMTEQVREPV